MPRTSASGWSARAIAASIERSVHEGRVQPSEALPPVRELAHKLKVSPATAAAAYRLLRARGLTAAQGRRGTRVIPRPHARVHATTGQVPDGVTDLASGNPDPALLPPLAAALRDLDPAPVLYDRPPVLPALLRFVTAEFEADGLAPAAITIVGGALDGIDRTLREHLRAGDRVAMEDPCFPAVHDLLVAGGHVPVPFEIDGEGPVPASLRAALQQNCRALIITTRAQNPTGGAISGARATELRALLRQYPDVLLVENDPCGPVAGAAPVTLTDSARHRWVHVKSTAKFLGPDLRVAFLAGDALTIDRVAGRYAAGPRRVSYLLQQLVLTLWSDPSAGRQLARASEVYRERRDALLTALAAHGVPAQGNSGLNVWVPLAHETATSAALLERGWAVAAGEPFRLRAAPGIRVTIAALQPPDAARFVRDLADAGTPSRRPSA